MPSLLHEALVLLFRNRPSLAPELLGQVLGQTLPDYDHVELREANLSQITPTEYHADLVVLLRAERPLLGIVLEVQLGRDEDKRYSWPLYAAALRAQLRCPSCVLVVTAEQAIARWAEQPIDLGSGSVFVPLVLGPEQVPRVTDPQIARTYPELSILSVQAHGKEPDARPLLLAALEGMSQVDTSRSMLYYDLVLQALSENTKRQWEELMHSGTYTYQSDFARKYFGEGEAKGRVEGEAKGRVEALLKILSARGLTLSKEQQSTLTSCTELAVLDRWIEQAITAKRVEELFEPT